jgi:polo-like kinase 4
MEVWYPNNGNGEPLNDTELTKIPSSEPDAVFNCQTLSKENMRKYTYASRFVDMVKSKTAKITLYTEKARSVYMENAPDPDFEITFYEGAGYNQGISNLWVNSRYDNYKIKEGSQINGQ